MRMRFLALLVVLLGLLSFVAACDVSTGVSSTTTTLSDVLSSSTSQTTASVTTTTTSISGTTSASTIPNSSITTSGDINYDSTQPTQIGLSDEGVTLSNDNGGVVVEDGTITLSSGGSYRLTGSTTSYVLVVSADENANIVLILANVRIESDVAAPVAILTANKVSVVLEDQATAVLIDRRSPSTEEVEADVNAALYSACDMTISGFGTLIVETTYNNGISSKDDLKISEATITVTAANHGIKGSDSLTIKSGTIAITAVGGDGLKTSNSDVSAKGNQRGTVTIQGGILTIHAACDGIDAAYNLLIEGDSIVNIYTTQTYATGVGEGSASQQQTLYVRIASSSYSSTYRYAFYFTSSGAASGQWVNATLTGSQNIMGRIYYFYQVAKPVDATSYTLYRFAQSAENSTTVYHAKSSTATINAAFDTLAATVSGSSISVSWTNAQSSGNQGLPYSAKGLKADNAVIIRGGTIEIKAYDDAIHANSDVLLENGLYGAGTVTISGGTITATTKDDAVHADTYLVISGGTIHILTSYEGLESCDIAISGGTIMLTSTDDGINAKTGSVATRIVVSGGLVDITVGTGDTDAIDSNGSYLQTGGFVVSRSALNGGMGGALDAESTVSITGGTFIALGQSEKVAVTTGSNRSTGKWSLSISAGTYEVKNASGTVLFTFTASTTYSQMWMSSNLFQAGQTYTLIRGTTTLKTWTQA